MREKRVGHLRLCDNIKQLNRYEIGTAGGKRERMKRKRDFEKKS